MKNTIKNLAKDIGVGFVFGVAGPFLLINYIIRWNKLSLLALAALITGLSLSYLGAMIASATLGVNFLVGFFVIYFSPFITFSILHQISQLDTTEEIDEGNTDHEGDKP